jgi:hypothetical protein
MQRITHDNSLIELKIFNIDFLIQKSKDTSIFTNPKYSETSEQIYGIYRDFIPSKEKSYWALEISYRSLNKNAVILNVDSITIIYDSTNSSNCKDCFEELPTIKSPYSPPPYIWLQSIEPIGIPKKHKKDVGIKFILKIFDEKTESLLTEIPINLLLERKKKFYTPLWPGV